jgi:G:T/U-mismatch repair DNA glycosylase
MLIWSALLFLLGVLAFLDSVFNMGEIFRQVNSVVFLLVSLALLIRTSTKAREQKTEKLQSRVFNLEREVNQLKSEQKKLVEF